MSLPSDSIQIPQDSIKIAFWQVVESNKAFTQLETLKQVVGLQEEMIYNKGAEAAFYHVALDHCLASNDTLTTVIVPRFVEMNANRNKAIKEANLKIDKLTFKAGVLTISLPILGTIAIGIGIALGSLIH